MQLTGTNRSIGLISEPTNTRIHPFTHPTPPTRGLEREGSNTPITHSPFTGASGVRVV